MTHLTLTDPATYDSDEEAHSNMADAAGGDALWDAVTFMGQALAGADGARRPPTEDGAYALLREVVAEVAVVHDEINNGDALDYLCDNLRDAWSLAFSTEIDRFRLR